MSAPGNKRTCSVCGTEFTQPGTKGMTYEMPSMFEPTDYACSKACYDRWCRHRR